MDEHIGNKATAHSAGADRTDSVAGSKLSGCKPDAAPKWCWIVDCACGYSAPHFAHVVYVSQQIGLEQQHITPLARLQGTRFLVDAESTGGFDGRRLQCFERCETSFYV